VLTNKPETAGTISPLGMVASQSITSIHGPEKKQTRFGSKSDYKVHYLSQRMCCILLIFRVMIQHYILLCVLTSLQSYAVTIGPVSDLVIANAQVSPDGFIKSSVSGVFSDCLLTEDMAGRFLLAALSLGLLSQVRK
jgi:hypothetical protein